MTKEVKSFLELLESKGSKIKAEELTAPRLKVRTAVKVVHNVL
jgi:hypothetical protein